MQFKAVEATPNMACTETFVQISPFADEQSMKNCHTYIKTKFFRFLVMLKKNTQNGTRGVYQFVPLQDFSKSWTDEELYAKYGLTQEEIDFIESMIRPME
jgi:site-specific DNA-methyltransferase (adenine-specific)